MLQLRRADVADLPWPEDTDVLQVTWCPLNHIGSMSADVALHWRRAADLTGVAEVPAPDPEALTGLLPIPCTINPELIVEYPTWDLPTEIATEIRPTVDQMAAETGWEYWHNSVAPGIKVGGYPSWTQPPDHPYCACGRPMDHLLSISSWEYDRGDDLRWITNEERPAIAASWADTDNQWHADAPWRQAQAPAGLMIGDAGGIYIFVCTTCPANGRTNSASTAADRWPPIPPDLMVLHRTRPHRYPSAVPTSGADRTAELAGADVRRHSTSSARQLPRGRDQLFIRGSGEQRA